jgi:hypothetical protein
VTCTEALRLRGYSIRPFGAQHGRDHGRREIVAERTGRVVARLTANEAWTWIAKWDRKVREMGR